ncbi:MULTISPECIES: hypothetical protein [unclassified Desulfovibrio]|uniref:hypothetical protein n=1 Tax=unclassified Desulfovibrio TaxID=2593640 RepID=UPI002FDA755B
MALIRAQVGTRGHVKKRGKNPAFVSFLTFCFWLGIRQNRKPQTPLPIRFEEPHISVGAIATSSFSAKTDGSHQKIKESLENAIFEMEYTEQH